VVGSTATSELSVCALPGGWGAPGSTAVAPRSWVKGSCTARRVIHSVSVARMVT